MNKTHGFSLGIVSVMMTAFLAIMIVLTMSTNVVAISVLNSEHLVYVSGSPSQDNTTGEPTEKSDIDSSAAVALITISKGSQGNAVISPQTTTIKTGGEILILNNDSVVHTIRNGMGPDDPLSGRMFGVGPIEPKGFIEYVASNLQPGTYPFYSTSDPSIKGELVVTN